VSTDRRVTIDANAFAVEDLRDLPDEKFRALVDADLRRQAPRSGVRLKDELVDALRSPGLVERWYSMLCRMQKSVDGQLGARDADFHAQLAELAVVGLKRSDSDVRARQETLRADHHRARAATLRFKTGLDEAMLEARYRRDEVLAERYGSAIVAERDFLASRCRRLLAAIEQHRASVLDDLDGEEPDEIDTALWSLLRSPTETAPEERGNHETDAGRESGSRRPGPSADRLQLVGSAET
jgi:hypothetical protein